VSEKVNRTASICPDYRGCWLPPNIAPTNFVIEEPGDRYRVCIRSAESPGFVVAGHGPEIVIPPDAWRTLLEQSRGAELYFDVYVAGVDSEWVQYESIVNRVAPEEIDSHVGYRLLGPVQVLFANMGTYQRELGTYRQVPILESKEGVSNRCVNCHTYANNDPDSMFLHMRGGEGSAMLLARDGEVQKIDTSSDFFPAPGSYGAWHPNEKIIALSFNSLAQCFHTTGNRCDVFAFGGDIGLYLVESNRVVSSSKISKRDRVETFPAWSPDGKYLYFSSAKKSWQADTYQAGPVPSNYADVKFDLVRISFDAATGQWGDLETMLSSEEIGLSIVEPRVSPDGRFVLVTVAKYGCFPVFLSSSDLYIIDLETGTHRPLTINSDLSDSWHGWSSNGRWIVFASKRDTGLFGRLYFSYFDPFGQEQKPFVLPQEDPRFYESCATNFNAPEFAIKAVTTPERALLKAIYDSPSVPVTYDGKPHPYATDTYSAAPTAGFE
jgi:dipeptidyl aminopeptidase/acylaminoacyl peptidase